MNQLYLALLLVANADPAVMIRTLTDPHHIEVSAALPTALAKRLAKGPITQEVGGRWLQLVLVDSDNDRPQAILGAYEVHGQRLIFRPRHPLLAGQRYRATLNRSDARPATAEHVVPARPAEAPAVVERIYPTGDELPANLLKFYIHFSRPMRESEDIFDKIELRTDDGRPVTAPWRRTELWSADGKRLTLWIHPGRVKSGISLREALGPVLEPGKRYTLAIGADLCDPAGRPLGKEFTKRFRATEALRVRPLPEEWRVQPPRAGTLQPLVVAFPRPLDRALLDRFLTVFATDGEEFAGRVEVAAGERLWKFHPRQPWHRSEYKLDVDERLEDIAGNTPLRLFDTDLREAQPVRPQLRVVFSPR